MAIKTISDVHQQFKSAIDAVEVLRDFYLQHEYDIEDYKHPLFTPMGHLDDALRDAYKALIEARSFAGQVARIKVNSTIS